MANNELLQALADAPRAGNDSAETPVAETAANVTPVTETTTTDEAQTGRVDTTPDESYEIPQSVRDYIQQHPDQKPIVDLITGELKRGLTPKLQEAAEIRKQVEEYRKQLEGVDPQAIQVVRQLQELAQTDPAKVAEYFRQQAEEFERSLADAGEPDPLDSYTSDNEADSALVKEIQALKEWKRQQEQVIQQTVLEQEAQKVHRKLDAMETKYGIKIPDEQRVAAWQKARESGLSVDQIWLAQNHETLITHLTKKAKNEASTVIETKTTATAGNPAPVSPRADEPEETPKTFKDFLRLAKRERESQTQTF